MPILIGPMPGGQGKSTFCRQIALKDDYYASIATYPRTDRELYYATYGKTITELEEGAELRTEKQFQKLKSDISRPTIDVDPKYKPTIHLKRRDFFIMTTNRYDVVKEDNRRFLPFHIDRRSGQYMGQDLTPDKIRKIYGRTEQLYDEGMRAKDVLKEISKLSAQARAVTEDEPVGIDDLRDYLESVEYGTSNKLVKEHLHNDTNLSIKDIEEAVSWWKGGGYRKLGFEKVSPDDQRAIRWDPNEMKTVRYGYIRI